MSVERSQNLVAQLRDVDEHYARLEPARGAEMRLFARFEARTSSPRKQVGLSWRTLWRPLVVIAACLIVLAISLQDEIPRAQRSNFRPLRPSVPAASTDVPAPSPKSPPKPSPFFHDSIVPAPGPTNEPPKHVPPMVPLMQDMPLSSEDRADSFWSTDERMRRIVVPRRAYSFLEPQKATSFDFSSPDVYWPGTLVSKSDNPPRIGGGTSRTPSASHSHDETAEPAESNVSPVCQWPDALKQAADLDCSEKGLMLTELTFLDPCGNGQFRQETHECVETEIEACVTDTIGDGKTCQDPGQWKTLAYEICAKKGQQLTDLFFDFSDCGGTAKMAKFTCCTPAPPPPPPDPPTCHESVFNNDGTTCIDLGIVKQEAWDACVAEGGYLFDMKVSGDCPPGQASQIVLLCCEW